MSQWQGPEWELRADRRYVIAQVVSPGGVCAVLADAPVELVRAMVLAAQDEWSKRGV